MSLEDRLARAGQVLKSRVLATEAQVRAAVISPLLQALGWDPADPAQWRVEWRVEFDVGTGYVDDALFGPGGTALVFVEAKRPGNLDPKAEAQLFRYAANKGVPILVLTDGDTWDLYLSMAAGEPAERRFAHLTLTKSNDLVAIAADMQRYLSRDRVVKGKAKASAEQRLADDLIREQGRKALSAAWNALLAEPDELLRDSLIERVEQATGSRPWREDAEDFLRMSAAESHAPSQQGDVAEWLSAVPADLPRGMKAVIARWRNNLGDSEQTPAPQAPRVPPQEMGFGDLRGIRILGKEHESTKFARVHLMLASELQSRDASFLSELASLVKPGMRNPRAVGMSDPILRSDRGRRYRQVPGHPEWHLHVSYSAKNHQRLMREMTELAGLSWDRDVMVLFSSEVA